mmetsp:Transcript_2987/g.9039  ORF Transcript_2987/g.9039 Transcript_2987/m.9039 type:complete len:81 (+) Transcript_2987:3305-3547(+)
MVSRLSLIARTASLMEGGGEFEHVIRNSESLFQTYSESSKLTHGRNQSNQTFEEVLETVVVEEVVHPSSRTRRANFYDLE